MSFEHDAGTKRTGPACPFRSKLAEAPGRELRSAKYVRTAGGQIVRTYLADSVAWLRGSIERRSRSSAE